MVMTPSTQFARQAVVSPKQNVRLNQALYDRVNIASTIPTTAVQFFATPKGQNATIIRGSTATTYGKTIRDTNIETAGQTPQKAFLIVGISLDYIPISPANGTATSSYVTQDIMTLKNGASLEVRLVDSLIWQGPCKHIPAADPFTATSLNASLASGASSQGGIPMLKFPESVLFPPNTNFTTIWTFDNPTSAIALNATMDLLLTFWALMERGA